MKIRLFLWVIFLLRVSKVFAGDCDCPEHPGKLTRKIIDQYPLIFQGFVDSTSSCKGGSGYSYFTGIELYKGERIPLHLKVKYHCEGACQMMFVPGDMWLLYAKIDSLSGDYVVEYCERNRKYFSKNAEDEYIMYNESTFKEETEYLKSILLPAYFIEEQDLRKIEAEKLKIITQNRNIEFANGEQKIWILLGSSLFVIILIFVVKRFLK